MAWTTGGGDPVDLEELFLAADVAEGRSVMAYRRLRPLLALVSEAVRRADSAARLESALRMTG